MNVWVDVFVFVLGTMVGSFLNVVAYRYNTGYSVVTGRSGCLVCGKTLAWYELIPILSFLIQGGRCRECRCQISLQYPLVETAVGLLFFLVYRQAAASLAGPLALLFDWPIWSILLLLVVYDIRHKIIPDAFAYAFAALAAGRVLAFSPSAFLPALITAAVLFLFFFLLWSGSRGRWMGLGDAKLAVGIGLLLGPQLSISAMVYAFWSGAIIGLLLMVASKMLAKRQVTLKSEIPFAPFLVLGTFLAFFLHFNVLGF